MNIYIIFETQATVNFLCVPLLVNATIPIIQNYYAQCFSDLQHTLADVEQMHISFWCVSVPKSQHTGICHPHN